MCQTCDCFVSCAIGSLDIFQHDLAERALPVRGPNASATIEPLMQPKEVKLDSLATFLMRNLNLGAATMALAESAELCDAEAQDRLIADFDGPDSRGPS